MTFVSNTIVTEFEHTAEQQAQPFSEVDALIAKCRENNRAAQELLYKKYYGKMMALCMRYLKNYDDAMDVLNMGFLKIFKNLDKYNGKGSFEGWMYHIVRNTVLDHLRAQVKYKDMASVDDLESEFAVPASALHQLYAKDLLKLLDELPETTRIVFNLFAIDGCKHEEIGKILGISEGTSKWHVSEARKRLQQRIQKMEVRP